MSDICEWWQNEDSFWESPCGVAWQFTDGTPYQNGMRFCYKCGKPMYRSALKKKVESLPPSHNTGSPKCEQCEHYDISQGVYTVECYSCKRYHVDMFTQRAGA